MAILSAYIDINSGNLVMKNGIVQNINEVVMEAYSRIFTPRGTWWADTAFGSLLENLFAKGTSNVTANNVIQVIQDCLNPMLSQKRLKGMQCQVNAIVGFFVDFTVNIVDVNGNSYSLPLNYKGGTT
jgi:phage gp46-like protein